MKIALLGYGKMGKTIETLAMSKGDKIQVIINNHEDWTNYKNQLPTCDVAIDFSQPEVAVENILSCFEMQIPVVSGTTGWHAYLPEIITACSHYDGTLLYASNFSIGVTIFRDINKRLTQLMSKYPEYTAEIIETHHTQKLDSPSGTAITLAADIFENHNKYTHWTAHSEETSALPITSIREEAVTGTHKIKWKSEIDCIEIQHEAYSRQGFANGALLAAKWVLDKKGIFTMSDLL